MYYKLGITTTSNEGKSTVGDQYYKNTKSDILVGIRTRLQARQSEVQFLAEVRDFSLFQSIQTISWAWPASYSMGLSSFPGVKEPWCKIDHITPSSANANNEWNYTPTPKYPSRCGEDQLSFLYYNNDLHFMTSY